MILERYVFFSGHGMLGGAEGMFAFRTILLCVASFVISAGAAYLMQRIPVIGRYIVGRVE